MRRVLLRGEVMFGIKLGWWRVRDKLLFLVLVVVEGEDVDGVEGFCGSILSY